MKDHVTSKVVAAAVERNLLHDDYPIVGVLDLDAIESRIQELRSAFPDGSAVRHHFAVKACSFEAIVKLFADNGIGAEVASPGELKLALEAGLPASAIILDSPVKTGSDLRTAMRNGVSFNIDNFEELELVDTLSSNEPLPGRVGVRINPQTGSGRVESVSTASITSKFGIPLNYPDNRSRIIDAYRRRPWLTQIHVHTGSLTCPLDLIAESIAVIYDLALAINAEIGEDQIKSIDIGGGLPVAQNPDESSPSFADYVDAVRRRVPSLFDGTFEVVTEFGRAFVAEAGAVITRAQYTKPVGDRTVVLAHAGAQIASRTVYDPESWPISVTVHHADGRAKTNEQTAHDIAGPCCFAGDLIATNRQLPTVESGDLIFLHNMGAYYLSSHYAYNDLPPIGISGFRQNGSDLTFETIRPQPQCD